MPAWASLAVASRICMCIYVEVTECVVLYSARCCRAVGAVMQCRHCSSDFPFYSANFSEEVAWVSESLFRFVCGCVFRRGGRWIRQRTLCLGRHLAEAIQTLACLILLTKWSCRNLWKLLQNVRNRERVPCLDLVLRNYYHAKPNIYTLA